MTSVPSATAIDNLRFRYRTFAEHEAHGVSPLYEQIAYLVAESDALLDFLSTFSVQKQQPNLLLAAVKFLLGTPADPAEFERWVLDHSESIRDVMQARSTQTNEPARCATLLPALASVPGPLALLEVGAAAGLCLLPDRYGYDYGRVRIDPPSTGGSEAPVFPCHASEAVPLPRKVPEVVWRGGLDLHPVELSNPDEVRWLKALVWPGQEGRPERLSAAIRLAQADPPRVQRGDLMTDLPALAAAVPRNATVVVFHSAVLAYLKLDDRVKFSRLVRDFDAVWISNEAPRVFPEIDAQVRGEFRQRSFILSVNGAPVAFTGPHGQFIEWLT